MAFPFIGSSQADGIKFTNIGLEDELSYSLVTSMVKDEKGFLWVATQNGLNKYDGYELKHYFSDGSNRTPLKNHISHLFVDSHGLIWIHYFREGIGRYNPKLDEFISYKYDPEVKGSFPYEILFSSSAIIENRNVFSEDKNGDIWVATDQGAVLYKRDNDSFEAFRYSENNESTLSNNYITVIEEDELGYVWVGTIDGLNKINKETGEIKRVFTSETAHGLKPVSPIVSTIFFHEDGSIWVGTTNFGLVIINNPYEEKLSLTHYNDEFTTKENELIVYEIYKTQQGKILIGTSIGLIDVVYENQAINTKKSKIILEVVVSNIIEDNKGFIWVGGDPTIVDTHIYRFNNSLSEYKEYGDTKKLINNYGGEPINLIQYGDKGLIYVGTIKGGFYIIDTNAKKFGLINSNTKEGSFLTSNNIYSIFEDSKSNLWIGSAQNLAMKNLKTGNSKVFNNHKNGQINTNFQYSKHLDAKLIGAINESKNGDIWLGSFDYKISSYDPQKKHFLNFHNQPDNPNSFTGWSVRSICVTKLGETFIGGTSMGLCKVNEDSKSFTYYTSQNGNGPSDPWVSTIIEDRDNNLWLGTFEGLDKFDPKTEVFTYYSLDGTNSNTSKINVRTILEPTIKYKNHLWLGTDKGLYKFNRLTGAAVNFSTVDGLPSNTILGILEDENGFLWISSLNGLTKLDPDSNKITNYTNKDGLQSKEFNEGAYFKSKDGTMYFGGINGITYFKSNDIFETPFESEIVLSELKINQNIVNPDDIISENVILKESISYVKELNLTHNERLISIKFASSNLTASNYLSYRYKLKGHEKEWNEIEDNQRIVKYSDLKSGNYILLIDSKFKENDWSKNPLELKINVAPYIWEKTWFQFLILIIILIGIRLFYIWRVGVLNRQKTLLEQEVKSRTSELKKSNLSLEEKNLENQEMSEKIHELHLMRMRFFTNISHEFRTPLTLILSPTEKLLQSEEISKSEILKDNLTVIQRNGKRLYKLINQLLELPKIDSANLKLLVSEGDIVSYAGEIVNLFIDFANSKGIQLQFKTTMKNPIVLFDADKIEKILYNLLSNAIHYSPDEGKIVLEISQDSEFIKIKIKDSGKGIPKEKLAFVFDRFYQIQNNTDSKRMSVGIGLALVQSLVGVYKGKIKVESEVDEGTEFNISLPYKKENFKSEEIIEPIILENPLRYSKSMLSYTEQYNSELSKIATGDKDVGSNKKVKIVVVEDNIDLNNLLCNELTNDYEVYSAFNGKEGLELVKKELPNIVISDVMMPEMDGIEMCNILKNDIVTSHIPVFLLTAKSEEEHQLEGLVVGADDYITKPFNIKILKLRVFNAIQNRNVLNEQFSKSTNPIPEGINISTLDHDLLERIISYVENNIEEDITGDILAVQLGLSKSNLYKKLKNLTGFSVNIYIRNIRLNIAAELLKKGNYSISEIAYAVGFNNPKYFSSCFMKYFGKSPRGYMDNFKSDL